MFVSSFELSCKLVLAGLDEVPTLCCLHGARGLSRNLPSGHLQTYVTMPSNKRLHGRSPDFGVAATLLGT